MAQPFFLLMSSHFLRVRERLLQLGKAGKDGMRISGSRISPYKIMQQGQRECAELLEMSVTCEARE